MACLNRFVRRNGKEMGGTVDPLYSFILCPNIGKTKRKKKIF